MAKVGAGAPAEGLRGVTEAKLCVVEVLFGLRIGVGFPTLAVLLTGTLTGVRSGSAGVMELAGASEGSGEDLGRESAVAFVRGRNLSPPGLSTREAMEARAKQSKAQEIEKSSTKYKHTCARLR